MTGLGEGASVTGLTLGLFVGADVVGSFVTGLSEGETVGELVTTISVGLTVGLFVSHLPSLNTLVPANHAKHSFVYVTPSQPHTKATFAVHVCGLSEHTPEPTVHELVGSLQN